MPGSSGQRECLNLHIGQAGCQIGMRTWELFCQEHKIDENGQRNARATEEEAEGLDSFFQETPHGQFVPRAIFCDTDPSTRDFILANRYKSLFHPEDVLGYKQDAKCNFFEGRSLARLYKIKDDFMERARKQVDQCDNLQGIFLYHSVGGGTGSGLTVEVLQELKDNFGKTLIFQPLVFPSNEFASSIVEPYNCVFAMHYMRQYVDLTVMVDNQAGYNMCQKNLGLDNPDFSDVNRLIAQVVSSMSTSMRYQSQLNANLKEIITNLVPDKRFMYAMCTLTPVRARSKGAHEHFSTAEIVSDLFEARNILCDCGADLKTNRYLAAVVLLRGVECDTTGGGTRPIEANDVVNNVMALARPGATHRQPVRFVPWIDSGFKVGVVAVPPSVPDKWVMEPTKRQGCMIGNNTCVRQLFVRQYTKFLKLFFNRAYVWQYIEANGDLDSFQEARDGVKEIIDNYTELLTRCVEGENLKMAPNGGPPVVRLEGA